MTLQVLTIFAEFVVLKFVAVEKVGIWQMVMVLQSYVLISRLGIINSFNREYPMLLETKESKVGDLVLNTTSFHVFYSKIFQGLFFLLCILYAQFNDYSDEVSWAFFTMACYSVLEANNNFREAKLRAVLNFNIITNARLITSFLSIILLVFPYLFSFYGMLIRIVIIQCSIFIYYYFIHKMPKVKLILDKTTWLRLFNDGWKIWLWSYLNSFGKTLPRLFLIQFGSLILLGLFTPINWIILAFTLFSSSLGEYLYPIFSKSYVNGELDMPKKSFRISFFVFIISFPFALIIYFLGPLAISMFLPKYIESAGSIKFVVFASLFDLFSLSSSVWVTTKEWVKLYAYTLSSILLKMLFIFIFSLSGITLLSVAKALLISSIISLLIMIFLIYSKYDFFKKKTTVLSF
jgi:O-antigen/teichoic acid export membrane protein